MDASDKQLPTDILRRANIRSGELAWQPSDIPEVIMAAKRANLVSLGGNLQVRVPSGRWGESIYASVDSSRIADDLPWQRRVEESAKAALADFQSLQSECDFVVIARESFPTLMEEAEAATGDPTNAVFFSWLVISEMEAGQLTRS